MIEANPHIVAINRDSDILGDRSRYICLDRNERVSPLSATHFADLVSRLQPRHLTAYPDLGPLYERLSRANDLPVDHLCVGAGSDAIIRRAFQAFLRPGDTVLSTDPCYAMYSVWARMFQAHLHTLPYDADFVLDADRFIARMADRPRIVVLANPDQPTGSAVDEGVLRRLIAAARHVDALMLVDEAYFPFWSVTAMGLVREFDNLLVTRSFSKVAGIAGLRLGFGAGQPSLMRPLHTVRGSGEVSIMAALAGEWLMDHPDVTEAFRLSAEEGRSLLNEAARRLGFGIIPTRGNFQLLRVPPGHSPGGLATALEQRGYLIRASFGTPALADCIRITIDRPEIMQGFAAALADIIRIET